MTFFSEKRVRACICQKKAVPLRAKLAYYAPTRTKIHMVVDTPTLLDGSVGGG